MSELKTRFIDDTYVEYFNTGNHELAQIYIKSEADKVIAEKDNEIRLHKYKRCLDKAEICRQEWCTLYYERKKYRENPFLDYLMSRKNRHREKWFKLAEKFKEKK